MRSKFLEATTPTWQPAAFDATRLPASLGARRVGRHGVLRPSYNHRDTMALSPGTRLGIYEVTARIGAGGMGEVYRARDTTLDRDVAVKILPDAFAADANRVARFQREARTLASLNHPNIAIIHGLEHVDGVHALVMELVEGEDLSAHIARGAIPFDDVLPIAKQIAEALEAAHEHGIIHRDLKPANIKVRPDGAVKVLDFGLAKPTEAAGASPGASQSPTITTPALTQAGIILGTAAYMSPEQARGKAVDKRTDIWAFGVVVLEMLTGRRAFPGDNISITLASVMMKEPDWGALPSTTPLVLRRLLSQCLKKDPKARLRDIGDARVQIEELLAGAPEDAGATAAVAPAWRRALPWGLGVVAGALLAATFLMRQAPSAPTGRLARFVITTPADAPLRSSNQLGVAISPDGSRIVYRTARDEEGSATGRMYVRAVDQVEAVPLRGADAVIGGAFSLDGLWIAYRDSRANALKRIPAAGGLAVTICSLDGGLWRGASWGPDDTIVFATDRSQGLMRVPVGGGTPERLTTVDSAKGESHHFWPHVLPNGRAVLFTVWNGSLERAKIAVASLPDGQVSYLLDGTSAHFSATGHLVFAAADRSLRAVGFDPRRLQVIGNPATVVERVGVGAYGGAEFALSTTGSLVYTTEGAAMVAPRTLAWVDRAGREDPVDVPVRAYTDARLSPDGTRVALGAWDEQNDIWIWDLARHTLLRLTTDPGFNRSPVWTADSARVASTADLDGVWNLHVQAADGSGTMERLSSDAKGQFPYSISPDGTHLLFGTPVNQPFDLGVLSLGATRTAAMLLHSATASEMNGEVSPDGRWMAYDSDESGRVEVYVRPFPNVESARRQVSTGGGTRPLWSRTGREIFYYVAPDTIMAVPVRVGADVALGSPRPVVKGSFAAPIFPNRHYDASADGQRFLLLKDAPKPDGRQPDAPEIHLVLNWFEELKTKVPLK